MNLFKRKVTQVNAPPARLFTLQWDNTKRKVRTGNARAAQLREETHQAIGTHYLDTGVVSLSTGITYDTLAEMEHYYNGCGIYSIAWHDEEQVA